MSSLQLWWPRGEELLPPAGHGCRWLCSVLRAVWRTNLQKGLEAELCLPGGSTQGAPCGRRAAVRCTQREVSDGGAKACQSPLASSDTDARRRETCSFSAESLVCKRRQFHIVYANFITFFSSFFLNIMERILWHQLERNVNEYTLNAQCCFPATTSLGEMYSH